MIDINKEFDNFFEFDTDDKSYVTSVSCKLFAEYIRDKISDELINIKNLHCDNVDLYIKYDETNLPNRWKYP